MDRGYWSRKNGCSPAGDRVDQIAQPAGELPEIDGGLDIHLGEIAAAGALHEHDPVALGHRHRRVGDALIADRDIQQRLVVELAEHPQRIVAVAGLELEIRPEPGGMQLAEQRRPRDRRSAQTLGGELVDRRIVREHHDRHPTPGPGRPPGLRSHIAGSAASSSLAGERSASRACSIWRAILSIVAANSVTASSAPFSPHPATYGIVSPPRSR